MKLLDQELPNKALLADETRRTMLSRVYQNPAMLKYLEDRHETLIKHGFDLFIAKKINDAERIAGQVYELRTLHNHLKVCYNYKRNDRNHPKSSLRGQTRNSE